MKFAFDTALSSFLKTQEECIDGSMQEYMRWLNSIDINSMARLKLAVSKPKSYQKILRGDGKNKLLIFMIDDFTDAVMNHEEAETVHTPTLQRKRPFTRTSPADPFKNWKSIAQSKMDELEEDRLDRNKDR
eukprot:scaffold16111_cov152-Skeletonema_dohrnii-CCMP3373.AAC.4